MTTFDKLGRAIVKALEEEGLEIVAKESDVFYTYDEMMAMRDAEYEYQQYSQEYD